MGKFIDRLIERLELDPDKIGTIQDKLAEIAEVVEITEDGKIVVPLVLDLDFKLFSKQPEKTDETP